MMRLLKEFEHLKIQLAAIKLATNNFADDHCIGKGGFGKVYKGEIVLPSQGHTTVAIKRLDRAFGQGDTEFWKEIIMLSVYKHKNIISLLGFCDESNEKILIYEYASKGSLDFYLDKHDLTWIRRLRICLGAARGLAFLHNPGATQQRVLHRDIKSSNILLDDNWNARISDLGLSKFGPANQQYTFLVSHTVGTIGYCDPQYVLTGLLTKESDVYSFGVVLFEILCGRLCIGSNDDKHRPFTVMVRQYYKENKINEIIYSNIQDEINPKSLKAFTKIAYQCLKRDHEERPLMTQVVGTLEQALEYQVVDGSDPVGYMGHGQSSSDPVGYMGHSHGQSSSDPVGYMGHSHGQSSYSSDDLPKTVAMTLNQESVVKSMEFHPLLQTLLLVGTSNGDILLWKVGSREKLAHKSFKIWDISVLTMPLQASFTSSSTTLINRVAWSPDGALCGVAFSKHIVHMYFLGAYDLKNHLEIEAHRGSVNDIAFSSPNKQLCIVTCGDDRLIKVWDVVTGAKKFIFEGHEAPVYSVCAHFKEYKQFIFSTATDGKLKIWFYDNIRASSVDYDTPGHSYTTMAYTADGTRLFSCGTNKDGYSYIVEWNDSDGTMKQNYNGFRKQSTEVVQFDTIKNRFLAAGDEFMVKFWDMDNVNLLTATDADGGLQASSCIRFNKDGNMLAVSTYNNGIKILANQDGLRLLTMESRPYDASSNKN